MHLADGDLIEPLDTFALRQSHVDKLGVHAFHVGEDKQLLDTGVIADVAFDSRPDNTTTKLMTRAKTLSRAHFSGGTINRILLPAGSFTGI